MRGTRRHTHGTAKNKSLLPRERKQRLTLTPEVKARVGGWSVNTGHKIGQLLLAANSAKNIEPFKGLEQGQDSRVLRVHAAELKQETENLRDINFVQALADSFTYQKGKKITHPGLVVRHEMDVDFGKQEESDTGSYYPRKKTWFATFFLEFKDNSCKDECCPTLEKWTATLYDENPERHAELIKKWLVKGYTDDTNMRTELGAKVVLKSGFREHLIASEITPKVHSWEDKQSPFSSQGVDNDKKRGQVNRLAQKLAEVSDQTTGGHFLKHIDIFQLHRKQGVDIRSHIKHHHKEAQVTYTHRIRLHYGACDPAQSTLVCHVVSADIEQVDADTITISGVPSVLYTSAEAFKQGRYSREEAVVMAKLVAHIKSDENLKHELIKEIPNYRDLYQETTVNEPEYEQQDEFKYEEMNKTLTTYFVPRGYPKPKYKNPNGKKHLFSDTFSVMLVDLIKENSMFCIFAQNIPPVHRVMTYRNDTTKNASGGYNLVDEYGRHLIFDKVITDFYKKYTRPSATQGGQQHSHVYYRDADGVPYTVFMKEVDGASSYTVRRCDGLLRKEMRRYPDLIPALKRLRTYPEVMDRQALENKEREKAKCYQDFYFIKETRFAPDYQPKRQHANKLQHRGYRPRQQMIVVGKGSQGAQAALLPPNPRRALQLGSRVESSPSNHAMSSIVVDLAEIKRFINSVVQSNQAGQQHRLP